MEEGGLVVAERATAGRVKRLQCFVAPPPIIFAACAVGRLLVNLLKPALPHIGQIKVACDTVKAEPPRVAEAQCPNFVAHRWVAHKRVIGGDEVVGGASHARNIEAEHFAQQAIPILGQILRVAIAAAIAQGGIQIAIWPKIEVAAVVVVERLGHCQDFKLAVGVGRVGIARAHFKTGNAHGGDDIGIGVGGVVINVKIAIIGVIGVKREAEQAHFVKLKGVNPVLDVEEGGGQHIAIFLNNPNQPRLFDNEQTAVARVDNVHGVGKPIGHQGEANG